MKAQFTGKERDSESGLDYFGARYYGSALGRWTSPDPSNWGVDFYYPQTWNHYSYVANNPLSNTDTNGLWLTPTHDNIIDNSFPGLLKEQRQILKDSSKNVDTHQQQWDQPMHSMDSTDNDVLSPNHFDPVEARDRYVRDNLTDAKEEQARWIAEGHTGISPWALAAFGNALHSVTDEYSPAHDGFQVVHWYSYPWHWREGLAILGFYKDRREAARNAAVSLYYETFGSELGDQASAKKKKEKVDIKIIYNTDNVPQE